MAHPESTIFAHDSVKVFYICLIARASLYGALFRSNPTDVQLAWALAGPLQNVNLLLVRPCSKLCQVPHSALGCVGQEDLQ